MIKSLSTSYLAQHISRAGRRILDYFLPPRCLLCGVPAQDSGRLCADCWADLDFLQGPSCGGCGQPFEFGQYTINQLEGKTLCGTCHVKLPSFDWARAAVRYNDGSRRMVISFKHGDRTDYADFFAQLLSQAIQKGFSQDDVVIPVPLHKKRLRKRRYNQAALMAKFFAHKKGLTYIPDILHREKHTPPQEGNYSRRKRNVAGAFRISKKYQTFIKGKDFILVDDVYTTGATVGACAALLKRSGAKRVSVVTVARVCK